MYNVGNKQLQAMVDLLAKERDGGPPRWRRDVDHGGAAMEALLASLGGKHGLVEPFEEDGLVAYRLTEAGRSVAARYVPAGPVVAPGTEAGVRNVTMRAIPDPQGTAYRLQWDDGPSSYALVTDAALKVPARFFRRVPGGRSNTELTTGAQANRKAVEAVFRIASERGLVAAADADARTLARTRERAAESERRERVLAAKAPDLHAALAGLVEGRDDALDVAVAVLAELREAGVVPGSGAGTHDDAEGRTPSP